MSVASPHRTIPYRLAVAIAAASVAVVIAVTFLTGGWLGAIRHPPQDLVYTVEGEGGGDAGEPFTVSDGWELRWEKTGPADEIRWTDENGKSDARMGLPQQPLRDYGYVNIARGGRYQLSVRGTAKWKFSVYQFPSAAQ